MSDPNIDPREQLNAIEAALTRYEDWIALGSATLLVPALVTLVTLI